MINTNNPLILPEWANTIAALGSTKHRLSDLLATGMAKEALFYAKELGYVSAEGRGFAMLYSASYLGRKAYSAVKTDQVLAQMMAEPQVATHPVPISTETWTPPKWQAPRPESEQATTIKSKGF